MKNYLISYDLSLPESYSDYVLLGNLIKSFEIWAHPLQSVWFVKSSMNAGQIRDFIKTGLDSNDKVVVVEVNGSNWGTSNIQKSVTDWMHSNLRN